ncbi:hypothetical protein PC116_g14183 [Phytophthora cactorum]|nr:hypothetical protein PC116_g14183 [Phytophthora cactorum]
MLLSPTSTERYAFLDNAIKIDGSQLLYWQALSSLGTWTHAPLKQVTGKSVARDSCGISFVQRGSRWPHNASRTGKCVAPNGSRLFSLRSHLAGKI